MMKLLRSRFRSILARLAPVPATDPDPLPLATSSAWVDRLEII